MGTPVDDRTFSGPMLSPAEVERGRRRHEDGNALPHELHLLIESAV